MSWRRSESRRRPGRGRRQAASTVRTSAATTGRSWAAPQPEQGLHCLQALIPRPAASRCLALLLPDCTCLPRPAGPCAGGGVGGMLKAVIDTVIGNLQLSISNVHIRWALLV